ncbi:MAG: hypothetical protein C4533_06145 [Candidatus Omnitrophota bacterium]|jgi:hypothetical protein|nr:MAG: hypothetical protein C4533_06145 [Candidatus Omnitrophota bacterium]
MKKKKINSQSPNFIKEVSGVLILMICLCAPVFAFAETINLKSGQRLENVKITEKTEEYVKVYNYSILDDGQDAGFVITYKTSEIDSIEPDKSYRKHSVVLNKIVLKSGDVKMGVIADANQDNIKLEDAEGSSMIYPWDDIDTIDGRQAGDLKSSLKL